MALLDRLELGDHVCWTVDDDDVRRDEIAAVLHEGLLAKHKVVYSGAAPETILSALARRGAEIRPALDSGQLTAATPEGSYLAGGSFDPEGTLAHWQVEKARSRAEGYRGLRVVGEMNWAQGQVPGSERLDWYEARCNTVFADGYVMGVCAYDRRLFDPVHLRRLALAHPGAAGPLLPFDPETSLRIRRTDQPYGLWLAGEADMSNRHALRSMIEEVFLTRDCEPVVTLDVTALRFADTAAARVLLNAAATLGRMHVVGCSPVLVRLLFFHGAEQIPGLLVTSGYPAED
ncbi:MEDS domain-containing protein [Paractinoplanes lichenicola]|uniref:MEDS domain-containing protein n=1 Tax=Paractinoplanes lichenicola TaxID=2802976 RepID=A0ABS1VTA1_9ACTN|nr:MEDS domain-containing protein [Actinoplanes lichenicola]MBL7257692.1 MEDS domain-containing protein [Actinoplanes lichenicola]